MSITLGLIKAPPVIQNLAMSGKIKDITTLNLVNRLYEQNALAAEQVVQEILEDPFHSPGPRSPREPFEGSVHRPSQGSRASHEGDLRAQSARLAPEMRLGPEDLPEGARLPEACSWTYAGSM